MRNRSTIVVSLCVACIAAGQADADRGHFQLRKVVNRSLQPPEHGIAIPEQAVRVFVHEGEPVGVRVHADTIAVDYGRSGVLFDRKTGQFLRRFTLADGYHKQRPKEFPAPPDRRQGKLIGPGVLNSWVHHTSRVMTPHVGPIPPEAPNHTPAASVKFDGQLWEAMQPRGFFQSLYKRTDDMRKSFNSWASILDVANAESFLQVRPADGNGKVVRYTTKDGLASNLITHLAVGGGRLWAACVDIYDPARKDWGVGGLSCFDPKTGKWSRVDKIDGRPVRWVTLLQTVGEDLWVGFREGSGVAGDKVAYGMGLYPRQYRPVATAVTLARLSKGKWTIFSRPPLDAPDQIPAGAAAEEENSPRETPRNLAVVGDKVFLFSQSQSRALGGWDTAWAGHLSLLDLATGKWRGLDTARDLAAYELHRLVVENREVLLLTDQGVRRWMDKDAKWTPLDPQSPLVNPTIGTVVPIGKELWVGYTNQSFGVIGHQGISRFDEEKMTWSYTDPNEIGTSCPVKTIVPLEKEVLVLFGHRQYMGSAAEFPFYRDEPRGPAGLGRFAAGKWEFPFRLDGVPESITRTRKGPNGQEKWDEKLKVCDLIPAGGKVFVFNQAGLYEGPGKWRQVLALDGKSHYWSCFCRSADGKTIEVLQEGKTIDGQLEGNRRVYDPATGKTTEGAISYKEYSDARWNIEQPRGGVLRQDWTEVPTAMKGSWALGELDSKYHRIVETRWAVWIVSTGQLIRLDRKLLADWLVQ